MERLKAHEALKFTDNLLRRLVGQKREEIRLIHKRTRKVGREGVRKPDQITKTQEKWDKESGNNPTNSQKDEKSGT